MANDNKHLAQLLLRAVLGQNKGAIEAAELEQILSSGVPIAKIIETLMNTRERKMFESYAERGSHLYVAPGHYYSPHVEPSEAKVALADAEQKIKPQDIDFNTDAQVKLWHDMQPSFAGTHFSAQPVEGQRYYHRSGFYSQGDGLVLSAMLRHFRPKQFIEVGSGLSSACALDTVDKHFAHEVAFTFIDPNPERLLGILRPDEKATVLADKVQNIPLEKFAALNDGDFLFIDSSHVLKTGSDLHHELFKILPVLKPGVIIHFHDIHYPFEYSEKWVLEDKREWNEAYALRAFLMHNDAYDIMFFNDYLWAIMRDEIWAALPDLADHPHSFGSGLWLRKRP